MSDKQLPDPSLAPPCSPVIDGNVLPATPRDLYLRGGINAKTVAVGIVQAEMTKHARSILVHQLVSDSSEKLG